MRTSSRHFIAFAAVLTGLTMTGVGPGGSSASATAAPTSPRPTTVKTTVKATTVKASTVKASTVKATPTRGGAVTPTTIGAAIAQPSVQAKMICQEFLQEDLAVNLGVRVIDDVVPTWKDGLYSCVYRYPSGSFTLSVKELTDDASTKRHYGQLAAKLGTVPPPLRLGDEAFIAKNSSVVVRKDHKVLVVDVTKLPAAFGRPPLDRLTAAETIAITVMECWTGG